MSQPIRTFMRLVTQARPFRILVTDENSQPQWTDVEAAAGDVIIFDGSTLGPSPAADVVAGTGAIGASGGTIQTGGFTIGPSADSYVEWPISYYNIANRQYVDAQVASAVYGSATVLFVDIIGDTMEGPLIQPYAPSASGAVTNKAYVDNQDAGVYASAQAYGDMTFAGIGHAHSSASIAASGFTTTSYVDSAVSGAVATASANASASFLTATQGDGRYAQTASAESISALWTFSVLPSASVVPTGSGHLTTKVYVDDALAGKASASHTHALSDLTQSAATTGQVATWSGAAWVASGAGTSLTFADTDPRYVNASGDTMTGQLVIASASGPILVTGAGDQQITIHGQDANTGSIGIIFNRNSSQQRFRLYMPDSLGNEFHLQNLTNSTTLMMASGRTLVLGGSTDASAIYRGPIISSAAVVNKNYADGLTPRNLNFSERPAAASSVAGQQIFSSDFNDNFILRSSEWHHDNPAKASFLGMTDRKHLGLYPNASHNGFVATGVGSYAAAITGGILTYASDTSGSTGGFGQMNITGASASGYVAAITPQVAATHPNLHAQSGPHGLQMRAAWHTGSNFAATSSASVFWIGISGSPSANVASDTPAHMTMAFRKATSATGSGTVHAVFYSSVNASGMASADTGITVTNNALYHGDMVRTSSYLGSAGVLWGLFRMIANGTTPGTVQQFASGFIDTGTSGLGSASTSQNQVTPFFSLNNANAAATTHLAIMGVVAEWGMESHSSRFRSTT